MTEPRICWYCGKETMLSVAEALHPYRKCSACGATAVDIIKLSAPAFINSLDVTPNIGQTIKTYHLSARRRKAKHD